MWLSRAGYHTAHIGKYLNGYGRRSPREVPAGWREWYGSVDPTTYNFFSWCLNENGGLVDYGPGRSCRGPARRGTGRYQADVYTHKAVDFIDRRASAREPFFLSG